MLPRACWASFIAPKNGGLRVRYRITLKKFCALVGGATVSQIATVTLSLLLVWATSACAEERILYRSVLAGDRVVYSDAPIAGARSSRRIIVEPHPADERQALAAQHALALTRARLLKDFEARTARLQQLDNEIASAYERLGQARLQQERGRGVRDGERQGRRLTPPYWQRQRALENAVTQHTRQLDALVPEPAPLQ